MATATMATTVDTDVAVGAAIVILAASESSVTRRLCPITRERAEAAVETMVARAEASVVVTSEADAVAIVVNSATTATSSEMADLPSITTNTTVAPGPKDTLTRTTATGCAQMRAVLSTTQVVTDQTAVTTRSEVCEAEAEACAVAAEVGTSEHRTLAAMASPSEETTRGVEMTRTIVESFPTSSKGRETEACVAVAT